jgi:hypothetical protein
MWKDAVGSSVVHVEMPLGDLILHVDQLPGADALSCPRLPSFPDQVLGARHCLALAP